MSITHLQGSGRSVDRKDPTVTVAVYASIPSADLGDRRLAVRDAAAGSRLERGLL